MKSIFVFVAFLAMATATAIKPENFKNSQNAEERFLVSSGGSNYLTLNSTLIFGTVIALGVMIGLVVALHSAVSSARAQKKQDKNYEETTFTDESDYAHTRYRRFSNNGNITFYLFMTKHFDYTQHSFRQCFTVTISGKICSDSKATLVN